MRIITLLAAVLIVGIVAFSQNVPTDNATIQGKAVRAGTSTPVAGAVISIGPPALRLTATTDAAGRFVIGNIPAATYPSIRAVADGYVLRPASSGITVVPKQHITDYVVELSPLWSINGRVRDTNGEPAVNVTIEASQIRYDEDGRKVLASAKRAVTDDRGAYSLFWLDPGEYLVRYLPLRGTGAASSPKTYDETYYPGTTDPTAATRIVLQTSSETAGIDFRLIDSGLRISGKLVSPIPPESRLTGEVRLMSRAGMTEIFEVTMPSGQITSSRVDLEIDPTFEVRGVRPGSYDLYAMVQSSPAGLPIGSKILKLWGKMQIDVTNQDLNGITILLRQGVEVKGQLVSDGQIAPSRLEGTPVSLEGRNPLRSLGSGTKSPGGKSTFTQVAPGEYFVSMVFGANPGFYIADIRQGGRSVNDTGRITVENDPVDFQVIISEGVGRLEGTVQDATGRPVVNAFVRLVPTPSRRRNNILYRGATTDGNGRFTVPGVAPGEYKAFAWEVLPRNAERNAEFISQYEARGVAVKVIGGASVNVNIPLIIEGNRKP